MIKTKPVITSITAAVKTPIKRRGYFPLFLAFGAAGLFQNTLWLNYLTD